MDILMIVYVLRQHIRIFTDARKRHDVEEQEGRVEKNVEGNVVQERI